MQSSNTHEDGRWIGPMIVVISPVPADPANVVFQLDLREYYGKQCVRFTAIENDPTEFFDPQFGGVIVCIFDDGDEDKLAEFFASPKVADLKLKKVLAINGGKYPNDADLGQDETLIFWDTFENDQINVSFRQHIGLPLSEEPIVMLPITKDVSRSIHAKISAREPLVEIDPEIAEVYFLDVNRPHRLIDPYAVIKDGHEWVDEEDSDL